MTTPRKIVTAGFLGLLVIMLAAIWWAFMAQQNRVPPSPLFVSWYSALCIAFIVIVVINRDHRLWLLSIFVFASFIALMNVFSILYWRYGGPGNFNIPLSRLDAVYFALGTLSTAGTGNIVAMSETARAIQSLQMGLDLGFTVLAGGIIVSRVTSTRDKVLT